jgi:hypothetical protein
MSELLSITWLDVKYCEPRSRATGLAAKSLCRRDRSKDVAALWVA